MSAKRGCLMAQITAEADWIVTVQSAGGGPDPITLLSSGATAYLTETFATFVTQAGIVTGATWTVTGSFGESGTGLVTIDCDDPGFYVTWDNTNVREAYGFTADFSNVMTAQTGSKQAKTVFLPDCPKKTKHGDGDGGDEIDGLLYTYAPDGTTLTISDSASKVVNRVSWSHLTRAKSRISGETVSNTSWQQFRRDCHRGDLAYVSTGAPVRLIWDADTPGTYTTYKIVDKAADEMAPAIEFWNGLYRLELDLVKVP